MTEFFNQNQVVESVPGLSAARLSAFLETNLVGPVSSDDGLMFRPADLARLELLCDLVEHFDLEGDALGVVVGLIDQLHVARFRLQAMAKSIDAEPLDLRVRVGARFVAMLAI